MPHFLPWEEGAPQRKQEDQRLLGSWLPVGPRETGLPTSCSGQKEKHVGDFASQAEFLERREVILRDAGVGTVLLELPCSQWKAQQCDKHSERYSWVTREEWWSVTDGKLEWSGLGRNFNSQAHLRLFLSVSLASPFSPAMGPWLSPQCHCGWRIPQTLFYKGRNSSQGITIKQHSSTPLDKQTPHVLVLCIIVSCCF